MSGKYALGTMPQRSENVGSGTAWKAVQSVKILISSFEVLRAEEANGNQQFLCPQRTQSFSEPGELSAADQIQHILAEGRNVHERCTMGGRDVR